MCYSYLQLLKTNQKSTHEETYANEVAIMLLSDPKHNDFNFFMIINFGGGEKTTGPEGQQFLNIMKSISPIEK